jgi:hypothetical protein
MIFASLKRDGTMCANGFRVGFKYHARTFHGPSDVASAFGLTPLETNWIKISRSNAKAVLVRLLQEHQGMLGDRMPPQLAQKVADDFFSWFKAGTEFFTNGQYRASGVWDSESVTDATFDGGVVAHGRDLSGLIWIEDED